ncbi:MAG: GTP cyclohydrolase, FolE2/MptA family, partial [Myxococcota bacterium]
MTSDARGPRERLPDVQAERPEHVPAAPIRRVGVTRVRVPLRFEGRATVAEAELGVSLEGAQRGAHMSRFAEVLGSVDELSPASLRPFLGALRERLEARSAEARFRFPTFLERRAPVSGATGLLDVDVELAGMDGPGGVRLTLAVEVSVASLCPCSQAVSDYGAHNQRGRVRVRIQLAEGPAPSVAELVEIAERHASAPVYPALKREDERVVTMQAFDHPAFVEDMVRGVAGSLREDPRVPAF